MEYASQQLVEYEASFEHGDIPHAARLIVSIVSGRYEVVGRTRRGLSNLVLQLV